MAFTRLCSLDDVWEGEMESFEVDGHEVLVTVLEGGDVRAYQGVCPHQDIPLAEGTFDGKPARVPRPPVGLRRDDRRGHQPGQLPPRRVPGAC
jgi:hypothetical protein